MFKPKIKIDRRVYDKVRIASQVAGCASIEEFAERCLEKESDTILNSTSKKELSQKEEEDIAKAMQGLGYLE